jgi:hypothetical protein
MPARPLLLALFVLTSCERVDFIELSPSAIELKQANSQVWVEAKCAARSGVRATKAHVEWSVRDPTIATVSSKGLVKPVASGETEIVARHGEIEARAQVRVAFVERIEVEPKKITLAEGQEAAQVVVRAFGKDGRQLDGRTVNLSSRNKSVAAIVAGSSILPLDPGATEVDVLVDGVGKAIEVVVEQVLKEKPRK